MFERTSNYLSLNLGKIQHTVCWPTTHINKKNIKNLVPPPFHMYDQTDQFLDVDKFFFQNNTQRKYFSCTIQVKFVLYHHGSLKTNKKQAKLQRNEQIEQGFLKIC